MKKIFLTSFLFQKVLEHEVTTVLLIQTDSLSIGEKIQLIEGREGFQHPRSISIFRWVLAVQELFEVTTDDRFISLTLSSVPLPLISVSNPL